MPPPSSATSSLNRYGIKPPFAWIDKIASQIAFYPPNPPSYVVKRHPDGGSDELYVAPTAASRLPPCPYAEAALILRDGGKKQVAAALIPAPGQPPALAAAAAGRTKDYNGSGRRRVILFSHGNAVDLAQQLPFLRELSSALASGGCPVDIACYDYQGYGESKSLAAEGGGPEGGEQRNRKGPSSAASPSSSRTRASPPPPSSSAPPPFCPDHGAAHDSSTADALEDGAAALRWLLEDKGFRAGDVVFYGQSLGTAVATSLAASMCEAERRRAKKSRRKGEGSGSERGSGGYPSGLILHSPLASGLRVLKPTWSWWPPTLDIFPVARAAARLSGAKCLVIHGTKDDVVPFSNGMAVYEALPKESREGCPPLWVEGGGHCDLEGRREYLPRLLRFLKREAR